MLLVVLSLHLVVKTVFVYNFFIFTIMRKNMISHHKPPALLITVSNESKYSQHNLNLHVLCCRAQMKYTQLDTNPPWLIMGTYKSTYLRDNNLFAFICSLQCAAQSCGGTAQCGTARRVATKTYAYISFH